MTECDPARDQRKYIKEATLTPVDGVVDVNNDKDLLILITGPTGAGKSAFIEALFGGQGLGISKDQLDSCTQDIATYELNITWCEGPAEDTTAITKSDSNTAERVFILDSPGFSDSQLSEFEIIQMVNKWMKTHKCKYIDCIMYLCPITDIRLPGTKRRTMQMVKLLSGISGEEPGTMMVVTTMWDRLANEKAEIAAEERFIQLRDDVWKDLIDVGGVLTRFTNTHESALNVMTTLCVKVIEEGTLCEAYYMVDPGPQMHLAPYVNNLYQELLDRIQNAQRQIQTLEADLLQPETQENEELIQDTEERLRITSRLLAKFEIQLINFGDPPPDFQHIIPLRQAMLKKHHSWIKYRTSRVVSKLKHLFGRGLGYLKAPTKLQKTTH